MRGVGPCFLKKFHLYNIPPPKKKNNTSYIVSWEHKDAFAIDIVQRWHPYGSQQNIFEYW